MVLVDAVCRLDVDVSMIQGALQLSGSALKAEGMKISLAHTEAVSEGWTERTLIALRIFCQELKDSGQTDFTFEQFRAIRESDPPITHKAWGSFASKAASLGIIRSTERYQKAKSAKTHSHPVLSWFIV